MNPVSDSIRDVNKQGEGAFIPYLMAGDPSPETSLEYIEALGEGGADVIELGVPFSDPVADGPTIQAAGARALGSMGRLEDVLGLVREVRSEVKVPIILMSYYNPIFQFGGDGFISKAKEAGVDGLILPDLPVGEGLTFFKRARNNALETPLLATPDTDGNRLSIIAEKSTGFLYLVSRPGTTGVKDDLEDMTMRAIKVVRSRTPRGLPVCVGFGLSTPDQVARIIEAGADGAIVGSAIVEKIGKGYSPERIERFVRKLKKGTRV